MMWTDVAWPAMGAASLTLGLIHLAIWIRQPSALPRLFVALMAIAVFVTAISEHLAIHTASPAEWGELLRWQHVPVSLLLIAMCAFVHTQFPHSSRPLFLAGVGTRLLALGLNFGAEVNLNFLSVDALERVAALGGDAMPVPVGRVNPLMAVGQGSVLLMVIFLAHALWSGWRAAGPDERQLRARTIGVLLVYLVVVDLWRLGVVFGWHYSPDVMVPGFLLVAGMLTWELADEVVRSGELATRVGIASARLEESEITMATALEAARVGLWTWRPGDDRLGLDALGSQLLGDEDAGGFDAPAFQQRVHPYDRQRLQDALRATTRDGAELRCEFRMALPDGRTRWLTLRGHALGAPNPPHGLFVGVVGDITERKETEEMLQLVVDASPAAMLMVGVDGRIVLANRQAETVFGYPPSMLLGTAIEALVPAPVRAAHVAHRAGFGGDPSLRAMAVGREFSALRADGSEIPVEVALNPIRRGDEHYVLASVTDIRARKRAEQEEALRREELAHLSRVAMLSELSGSLAHELNQPLTAILSNAQAAMRFMAQDPPNLGEVAEILENIVESDKRAGDVIRKLRSMLRKETSEFRRLDLNEVVSDVMRIIRSDLLNRGIRFALDLAPEGVPVRGDAVTLQQVLLNLVMNAADAMAATPPKERTVTIRTLRRGDDHVGIDVADVGTGIPEASLAEIFSPFVTTKRDGLGLGLAVCESIVGTHRGRLWASNNAGGGATVHVELPAAPAAD